MHKLKEEDYYLDYQAFLCTLTSELKVHFTIKMPFNSSD